MPTAPITDVREMRQAINKACFGSVRVDGAEVSRHGIPPAASMIRQCLVLAEREGWNGDDTMTFLAYHALVGFEQRSDMVIEHALTTVQSPIFKVYPNDEKMAMLVKACHQAIAAIKGREHDGFLRDAIEQATGVRP